MKLFRALELTQRSHIYLMSLLQDNLGGVKEDDIYNVMLSVASNPNGRYFIWYFVREYWSYLSIRFAETRKLSLIVKKLSESFENAVLLEELDIFIETTYDENADLRFKALDNAVNNFYWAVSKESDKSIFLQQETCGARLDVALLRIWFLKQFFDCALINSSGSSFQLFTTLFIRKLSRCFVLVSCLVILC
ncbi:glutamyl aminopeptidase [Brachionus plicatilis]|uniref:Glutamyl aminopeptidase n=1 Tax=Brachionus plicatilis TaxID=10195 RepID=A0A3M7R099_BRAPC|nr:glutamyl aminopeptidase [Brachionus plicatilis]